jgi:PleD family two-component response regulator
MRIKILLFGNDPVSLVPDIQLLRERGLLVFTAFNPQNIEDLVNEIKPDVVFFDTDKPGNAIRDTYNNFINNVNFTNIPVIFTLSDDDVYLVTRKRTASKSKRTNIADNIMSAIKKALQTNSTHVKNAFKKGAGGNYGPTDILASFGPLGGTPNFL